MNTNENMAMSQQTSILVVEDDASLREALVDTLELSGYHVKHADNGIAALEMMQNFTISMVISDVQMPKMNGHQLLKQLKRRYPDTPVLLMTAYGTIDKAIEAMKDGAIDYLVKPFEPEVLVSTVSKYIGSSEVESTMIAVDQIMQDVSKLALRVAYSNATVMITGESGTGKEVLAKYIHNNSSREEKPFVAINCAAIPENMLEATLFGYEKGAFTGAYKASMGKFEQANGGTLLLDEISEMDLALQAKILRVIQEKEVERLGGHEMIELDVRILATSNRNMLQTVKEGKFREDLYYRLNVFPIKLPSLAQRQGDIVPLSEFLLEKIARANAQQIPNLSVEAEEELKQHTWPGNIRELDNVLQRAFILHMDGTIKKDDIAYEQSLMGSNNPITDESVDSHRVVYDRRAPRQEIPDNQLPESMVENQYCPSQSDANPVPTYQYDHYSARQISEKVEMPKSEALESDTMIVEPAIAEMSSFATMGTLNEGLKSQEYKIILDILASVNGNRKMTSEKLGISQRTLRYKLAKMRDLGIEIPTSYAAVAA